MQSGGFLFSGILHAAIILWLCLDWSFSMTQHQKSSTPVIMVDLNKVQIGETSNLPPQIKKKPQKQTVKKSEAKTEHKKIQKTKQTTKQPPKPTKPKEQPKKKNTATAVTPPKKENKTVKKTAQKNKPTDSQNKQTQSKQPQKKKTPDLTNLLASVEKIKQSTQQSTTPQTMQTGQEVQEGIENGTEGTFMQPLSISEKDLIVNKLRSCWNVNAGLENIEKIIVEIRVYVNKDGSVRHVKILNMSSDAVFRSVAESAQRAVWICNDKGDESPFKILAKKRPDNYHTWKEIFVRFNPIEGVF